MGEAFPTKYYVAKGVAAASLPAAPKAIYVAELGDGRVAYVGQTRQGTAARLAQHARRWERAARWRYVWVIPVLDHVPDKQLDRIEGRIGRLLRPIEGHRLPRAY